MYMNDYDMHPGNTKNTVLLLNFVIKMKKYLQTNGTKEKCEIARTFVENMSRLNKKKNTKTKT